MENVHQRKKEPELIRQKILEHAMQLAAQKGVSGVSIQAVADFAGVTKGGVFHHYSSKQKLLDAMVREVLSRLDLAVDDYMQHDQGGYGCFTRAYIYFTLQTENDGIGRFWSAISMTMLTDHAFNALWLDWLNGRLAQHQQTDSGMELQLLRYAADGVWLNVFACSGDIAEMQRMKQELIQRSYVQSA
ncbi:TetR/AcrR family transcriptional regulator [Acinetobacter sp.]|jgi:AcrR family transcriptional regulator|uniref:TetR/AcrR family transcriptional regulator n=1 Tax=Acinetobacter sp. TaxID=472 RepID=UPI0035B233E3